MEKDVVGARSQGTIVKDEDGLSFLDCTEAFGSPHSVGGIVFGIPEIYVQNHSSHFVPSVLPSPADASSMLEELIARQGPSVCEMVSILESAGDRDKEFDRNSDSGGGRVYVGLVQDTDMSDAKKIKEIEF